jgi:aminoglycoside 3-N-acetyltransferase
MGRMVTASDLVSGFRALGVTDGDALVVHASLSALGDNVPGGAEGVVQSLLGSVGHAGTIVVPTFTTDLITDPFPDVAGVADQRVRDARDAVPLFEQTTPTRMGAVPTAVLARAGRLRSRHPQASVAAIGPAAAEITKTQPLAYALGAHSPFARLYDLNAKILLIGVGHNRNSFLHHAESRIGQHRRKLRRFPHLVDGERVWVEAPDVGDDNGRFFPLLGQEYGSTGGIRTGLVGAAPCQLLSCVPFVDFAARRLGELLGAPAGAA